jgi:hypothetical protein
MTWTSWFSLPPTSKSQTGIPAAQALYEVCGWRNVGEVTMVFGDGTQLQSFVYVGPRDAGR